MANILVIDAEVLVRASLRILLRSAGHLVAEAADGDEGARACRGGVFDLVLCDLDLSGGRGLEALTQIRRDFPGLPIITMGTGCGCGAPDVLQLALSLGAVGTLRKPFGVAALFGAVGEALGGRPPDPACGVAEEG
jgi:CheY-like chemotaxis protein